MIVCPEKAQDEGEDLTQATINSAVYVRQHQDEILAALTITGRQDIAQRLTELLDEWKAASNKYIERMAA